MSLKKIVLKDPIISKSRTDINTKTITERLTLFIASQLRSGSCLPKSAVTCIYLLIELHIETMV